MGNKGKKIYLVLILCISLMANGMGGLSGAVPVSRAAQTAEVPELSLPAGGLEQLEVYELLDEKAVENVPSYDNGILLYSNDIFGQGTGDYGYNSLSSGEKAFYDSLKVSLDNFNASEDASFIEVQTPSGSKKYTPFKVNFNNAGIDEEKAAHTWVAFRADHPWLFWLGGYAYDGAGNFMPMVEEEYKNDVAAVRELNAAVKNGVRGYINAVAGISDTYEKVRIIHDRIVNKVNYAYKTDGTTPEDADWAHSVLGILDGRHNTVVCEGYAKTFSFILNILGIPNVYIVGNADGSGHAWNAVSFDNGSTYYYMDLTWDDQGGKNSKIENTYIYFAMPKNKFETSHKQDTTSGTGLNWQYSMPSLGNDMDKTYFKKYSAYATDDMVSDTAKAEEFLSSAKEAAPGENCLMLLGDNSIKLVAAASGAGSYSYIPVNDYSMKLYTVPSGKTPTPEPSLEPGTEPSAEPSAAPSARPSIDPAGARIFSDYNYNNPVAGDEAVIYGNGVTKTVNGKKVNNKVFTAYTDITASYKYTLNNKGVVKPAVGKVIAAVTKSASKPEVNSKNKVTDTSASNIAKAKIKNGQITVTATGKEGGLVYLWVIDTGSKGVSAYCPVDVKLAPRKLEVQDTSGSKIANNTKLQNGSTLKACVTGIVSNSVKTNDCTYTATVGTNYQSYITVTPVQGSKSQFNIKATGLKNNKNTKAVVTFTCDQNGKKINFPVLVTN